MINKIYTRNDCAYCSKAMKLLDDLGIEYSIIKLYTIQSIAEFKKDCPGATTVPQIIIDGKLLGGFDKLEEYVNAFNSHSR